MRQTRFLVLSGVIVAMVAIRLIPYVLKACGLCLSVDTFGGLWNISPMTAVCLLGGTYFTSRTAACLVPLAAWAASSVIMCALMQDWQYMTYPGLPVVAVCFVLMSLAGMLLKNHSNVVKFTAGAGLALLCEVFFFLVTNAADWALMGSYAHTLAGLQECYVMGIPFFKHSIFGTAIFFPILFSAFALAELTIPALRPEPQPVKL